MTVSEFIERVSAMLEEMGDLEVNMFSVSHSEADELNPNLGLMIEFDVVGGSPQGLKNAFADVSDEDVLI